MGPGRRTRRYRAALGGALLLGAGLRLAVHAELAAADPAFGLPILDGRIFLDWAGRIAGGEILGEGPFFFNPLYPYAIAPVVAVAGGAALGAVRILQAVLGLATVLLVAEATRRLLGRRPAAVAAFLAAAWPAAIHFEQIPIGATLTLFVNALVLWLLARWKARPTGRRLLAAGFAMGLAVLGRPNAVLLPAALPLWFRRVGPAGRAFGIACAGVCLALLPVMARNLAVLGEPGVGTTSMGINLHLANNPLAWETGRMDSSEVPFNPFLLEEGSVRVAELHDGGPLSRAEASSWWTRRTLRECAAEPGPASLFLLRKALYFCGAPELPSSESFLLARQESVALGVLAPLLSFGLALPLALLGAASVLRRRRRALPLVLMLAVYAIGLVPFLPLAHYRLPVLPALWALAAAGAIEILSRRASLVLLGAGLLLSHGNVLAGAAGVRSLGPFPEPVSWMLAIRTHAILDAVQDPLEDERLLDLAERAAKDAAARVPPGESDRWLVLAAQARVAGMRFRLEEEGRLLDEALALQPRNPTLLRDREENRVRRGGR